MLEPIQWTSDGWFKALRGDLSRPMEKPGGESKRIAGYALSDEFSTDKFGLQWSFFNPQDNEMLRVKYDDKKLRIKGKSEAPESSSPLIFVVGDRHYEKEKITKRTSGNLLKRMSMIGCGM